MYAMDQMGMGYEVLEANGITIPVVSVACNYLNMSRYGETVEIAAAMASYNGVRMRITYEIRDKATGQLRATGETTHCFLAENGQPVVLKKHFPEGDAMFRMLLKISKQSQK